MSYWENSGKSNDWFTPKFIFDALGARFDLDVAAPKEGPLHVPCEHWIYQNSLSAEWSGYIWMNPPFGRRNSLSEWLDKFFTHGNGIALVPDRTSAPWFQKSFPKAEKVLFMPKVKFIRPDGSLGKSPSNGTALLASGINACIDLRRAANRGLGILVNPVARMPEWDL